MNFINKLLNGIFILIIISASFTFARAGEIELITNKSNTINNLDQSEVRAIFSMRIKTWSNNQPIHVFVLEQNNPVHEQFCKDILKIFPYQLQAGWDRLVFSGTGEAPKVFNSEALLIAAILSTPGSIGYILKEEGHNENINVHVITIQ